MKHYWEEGGGSLEETSVMGQLEEFSSFNFCGANSSVFHENEHVFLPYDLVHLSSQSKQLALNSQSRIFTLTIMGLSKGVY